MLIILMITSLARVNLWVLIMITSLTKVDIGVDNDNDNLTDQVGPGC